MTLEAEPGGLQSQATLTVFTADGKSMSSPLGHPGIGLFRSGACDQFTVSLTISDSGFHLTRNTWTRTDKSQYTHTYT